MESSTTGQPVETYEMFAPTGKQLVIGPKMAYTSQRANYESNYYLGTTGSYEQTTGWTTTNTTNKAFYWVKRDENDAILSTVKTNPSNATIKSNTAIADNNIYNGRLLAVPPVNNPGVHIWSLVNDRGNCIARFKITYQDINNEIGRAHV